MASYRYLIVGGGMAAAAAVDGIRAVDGTGSIGLISSETSPPYNRPPLSKSLWKGDAEETIWRTLPDGVDLLLGRKVTAIDPAAGTVVDSTGATHSYERLLLATGSTPRRLPDAPASVIYFRTVDDYRRLRAHADSADRFAVIGGGFVGSEVAAALAMNGKQVTVIFPEAAIGDRVFPTDLTKSVTDLFRKKGVTVLAGSTIESIVDRGSGKAVTVRDQASGAVQEIVVDGIVAGLGVTPNVELATAAGLTVDNGIAVDTSLRTSAPGIYAAGDVASFENPSLGRLRVEHEDNANTMGDRAGRSMAGQDVTYDHLPSFYSDLFELGYEAVGTLDSRLQTVEDWREPFREGVVYYLADGRVRGVLLWNVWDQVDRARALIADPGPHTPESLIGRIPG